MKTLKQLISELNEAKKSKMDIFDKRQHDIAVDTVRNPAKGLMGGPTAEEAEKLLRDKFKYTDEKIRKLKIHEQSLSEMYGRSPTHAGRSISQRTASRGLYLAAKAEDEDPEFHKERIADLQHAIKNNPDWAKLMLPKMQSQLEYHQKRLAQLENNG